jgi:hypothetical protein
VLLALFNEDGAMVIVRGVGVPFGKLVSRRFVTRSDKTDLNSVSVGWVGKDDSDETDEDVGAGVTAAEIMGPAEEGKKDDRDLAFASFNEGRDGEDEFDFSKTGSAALVMLATR